LIVGTAASLTTLNLCLAEAVRRREPGPPDRIIYIHGGRSSRCAAGVEEFEPSRFRWS